jgi:hypothetical protein
MKRVISLIIISFISFSIKSQVPDSLAGFKLGGFGSFALNQVSFSNWAQGGENAVATTFLFNIFGNYKRDNIAWDNSLDLGYGKIKTDKLKSRKNEDKIIFDSKFDYHAVGSLYYSGFLDFRTQFAKGYNYPNDSTIVSRFMSPGYISIGLGADYKPSDYFSVYVSPATAKFTIVTSKSLSDSGKYGVTPGKRVRSQFGASLNNRIQKDLTRGIGVVSNLLLFKSYTDNTNVVVNWEFLLNIKAGKFITTSLYTELIYDQSAIDKVQFKEALGLGISVKF